MRGVSSRYLGGVSEDLYIARHWRLFSPPRGLLISFYPFKTGDLKSYRWQLDAMWSASDSLGLHSPNAGHPPLSQPRIRDKLVFQDSYHACRLDDTTHLVLTYSVHLRLVTPTTTSLSTPHLHHHACPLVWRKRLPSYRSCHLFHVPARQTESCLPVQCPSVVQDITHMLCPDCPPVR